MRITIRMLLSVLLLLASFPAPAEDSQTQSPAAVTPQNIHDHLKTVGTWVDWNSTPFDGFKYNAQNRNLAVDTVGVVWHPSLQAVQQARDLGCDLLIFHEPLFFDDSTPASQSDPGYAQKKQILDTTGMVLYRSHDFQDRFPTHGVHARWREALGLTGPVVDTYQNYISVTQENPKTVAEWALQFAQKSALYGQPRIRVFGDQTRVVQRIAFGTGAVAWPRAAWQLVDADMAVTTELNYVEDAWWAIDNSYPLIAVDHGVSEIAGVKSCKEWMQGVWPALTWHFIENELEYRTF